MLFTKLIIEGVFFVVDSRVVETVVEDIIVDEFSLVDEVVVVGGAVVVVVVVEVETVEVFSVGRK